MHALRVEREEVEDSMPLLCLGDGARLECMHPLVEKDKSKANRELVNEANRGAMEKQDADEEMGRRTYRGKPLHRE